MGKKASLVKRILSDTTWSMAGLVLMNVVIQFFIYPVWSRTVGDEMYGNIIFIMSLLSIVAYPVGAANSLSRIKTSATEKTYNTPYLVIMLFASILMIPVGLAFCTVSNLNMSLIQIALFILLLIFTSWRYYIEVEYRLTLNYQGYFYYYFAISIGYLIGLGLYCFTDLWVFALLVGEILSILLVFWKGSILQFDVKVSKDSFLKVCKPIFVLFISTLIAQIIYNSDRILLKIILGGTAVSIYYIASLLGKTIVLISKPFNSVIMGYLARYNKDLTLEIMHLITIVSLMIIPLITVCCIIASHILIPLLYPQNYMMVKPYFGLANMAQVFCFVASVIDVILLRFANEKYQIYINVVYAVVFFVTCIPAALLQGIYGFCIALLITSLTQYSMTIFLGYYHVLHYKTDEFLPKR